MQNRSIKSVIKSNGPCDAHHRLWRWRTPSLGFGTVVIGGPLAVATCEVVAQPRQKLAHRDTAMETNTFTIDIALQPLDKDLVKCRPGWW